MHYIRYAFWAIVAICLVIVGLANRGDVTLRAMPDSLASLFGISPDVSLPVFIVIFIAFGLGMLIGLVWEYIREIPERAESRAKNRRIKDLERQVAALKDEKHEGQDEVLAMLEKAS